MSGIRRLLRLAAILGVSLSLASVLAATAWAAPPERRLRYRASFLGAWSKAMCLLLGIRVDVIGEVPGPGNRLVVSNHLGYADIPVLGSVLPGTFVSKKEVARWPLVGFLSNLAGTLFVDRVDRAACRDYVEDLKRRISAGGSVLVFPEGTSTRGDEILPFKAVSFSAVAGTHGVSVLPVHIDIVEIESEPAIGVRRDAVCWHGDAAFVPHLMRLLALRNVRYRIVLGRPIPCGDPDRKRLARLARERVVSLGKVSSRRCIPFPGGPLWLSPIP
ncbi:MAG: 1-acyl-sn-glycerol-3-phosphate acyltransferase [Deltaproteobacteria bacterium]|nr:1-acyl-sn-glycerol-3-phosphate acyltransferase [Deltaproteobacteria bacterium]